MSDLTVKPLTPALGADFLRFFDHERGAAFADNPEWAKCYCHFYQVPQAIDWPDFREADLILAVRPGDRRRATNKPASKLVNAWLAGVPALLGPEVAYRELRRSELEWFYQDPLGAASIFPDLWEKYLAPIRPEERGDMMQAYYRRLTSEDGAARATAARAWTTWEGATSFLRTNPAYVAKFDNPDYAAAFARIEAHYFVNRGFMESDDQLLRDIERIRHIPAVIVQGRYDIVCPMRSAWDLHRAWPEAELRIVPGAGHSAFEPAITHELVAATDRLLRRSRASR